MREVMLSMNWMIRIWRVKMQKCCIHIIGKDWSGSGYCIVSVKVEFWEMTMQV